MRTSFLTAVLLFFCMAFHSCRKNTPPASSSGSYVPFDGKVVISMFETLDSTGAGRHLQLKCHTTQIFGCCNFSLIYSISQTGNTFTIHFDNVYEPEICLTSTGPATATIDLGVLTNNNYNIYVTNGGLNTSVLNVSKQSYIISGITGPVVSYTIDTLMRVPDNTIWGEVCYDSSGVYPALLSSFMDSLNAYGVETVSFAPGDYQYFKLLGSNTFPHDGGCSWSKQFIYRYTGDMAKLKSLVWNYWGLSNKTFYIGIHNDKGYYCMSWYQH